MPRESCKVQMASFLASVFSPAKRVLSLFQLFGTQIQKLLESSPERRTEVPRVTLVPLPIRWNGSALVWALRLSPVPLWVQFNEYVMSGKKFPLISPPKSCSIPKSFIGRPAICCSGRLSAAGSCFSTPHSFCHFFFFHGCPQKILRPLFNLNL